MTFEPVDRSVQVGGLALHYRETGPAAGLPVVALHGHPGSAATWDGVAAGVCAAGDYRVLALTQRGYGRSGRVGPYTLPTYAEDLLGFVAALGLERFVLLGHSMGGTVAALAAERLAAERGPAGLLGLVLEDSVIPREGVHLPVPERPQQPESVPYDWELVPQIYAQLEAPDPAWWSGLARIEVPTLVIAGGPTSHVPQDVLADAAALMPRARLVTLEGAGHSVHRDALGPFLSELTGFLRTVRPASG
ncbi:alpha/beta hydrolase [Actinospica durhamensis]|uniref:Alpha/beta hydrolase n=1 Tax=Actinospica durhamensis TaxID=1508375 RepID=A0A941ELE7_9ACTN|nr:alpha/beta hydrolase [Actinospica durhamensis]MBR7832687.1 alpha/beta hydrolase [Actinospica durhamensis]